MENWQKVLFDKKVAADLRWNGIDPNDKPAMTSLENKVKSLSPHLGRIVCIGLLFDEEDREVGLMQASEREILGQFWEEIFYERHFISFNGLAFDVPFIITRSMLLGIKIPDIGKNDHPFLFRPKWKTKPHFDVAEWASGWNPQHRLPLDAWCRATGIPSPKGGSVKASEVYQAWLEGRLKEIMEYCLRDCHTTRQFAHKLIPYVNQT